MASSKKVESLDTSVLLRVLTNDVPREARRAQALIEDNSKNFLITDMVFFEVVYTLQKFYEWPRRTIATIVAGALIERSNIECNRNLIYQVLDDYVTHPKLSFGDCYLAWRARINGATPLWTFDKKLATQLESVKLVESTSSFSS